LCACFLWIQERRRRISKLLALTTALRMGLLQTEIDFTSSQVGGCSDEECGNIAILRCTFFGGQDGSPVYSTRGSTSTLKAIMTGRSPGDARATSVSSSDRVPCQQCCRSPVHTKETRSPDVNGSWLQGNWSTRARPPRRPPSSTPVCPCVSLLSALRADPGAAITACCARQGRTRCLALHGCQAQTDRPDSSPGLPGSRAREARGRAISRGSSCACLFTWRPDIPGCLATRPPRACWLCTARTTSMNPHSRRRGA
jgi:hypothetical protein